ncbi:MAG TPA: 50S ribosomal protein L20 [Candidatus Omnitrophica bacterium]|nr:50S ribosomal protein L20 [Candidatus Omnitrophota bacterium]
MARATRSPARRKKHKKILKMAKGYRGGRSKLYRTALETVKRALVYSYRDRRVRKRFFRRLWITRISAACQKEGISYSQFINGLNRAGVKVDRKNLAQIALTDETGFRQLVDLAKQHLNN